MNATRLILVGGFLGAGKTTLLYEAALRLTRKGHTVGLITNDQANNLVDTAFLARTGLGVCEVAGSCFCCDFDGFVQGAEMLVRNHQVDVILAEPVGSCTDLSATILQPVKRYHRNFSLAPLTVLADPDRLREVLAPQSAAMHASALYIVRKQLEEADQILLSKADTLSEADRESMLAFLKRAFPDTPAATLSTTEDQGLDAWLDGVMSVQGAGSRVVEVDYDTYAEGEAVLGWLNAVVRWQCHEGMVDWRSVCDELITRLHRALQAQSAAIGHVKLILDAGGKQCMANLTRLGGEWLVQGAKALKAPEADLILNVRVELHPDTLETLVREVVAATAGEHIEATFEQLKCISPGRPRPTHRFDEVTQTGDQVSA